LFLLKKLKNISTHLNETTLTKDSNIQLSQRKTARETIKIIKSRYHLDCLPNPIQ